MKGYSKGVQQIWEKYKYVILVTLVGIGLLLWPDSKPIKSSPMPAGVASAADLTKELTEILKLIEGVGQVQVMLTMETDGERMLAQDTDLRYSGSVEAPDKYERSSEIIMKDGTGGDEPMIVRTWYPTYRGALIVCQGGDRPEVRLAVTAAVMSLTGLSSDRISVAKYQ